VLSEGVILTTCDCERSILLGFLEAFFHLAVCRAIVFALLNMTATSVSKSVGIAMLRPLAVHKIIEFLAHIKIRGHGPTSERVRMQFSTLNRCADESQVHLATLKAACSNCTKMGCRV
jgi:hypothetical protein